MAENRRSGKLAVILHADVAGSTTLVQVDEDLAHRRIQSSFQRFGSTVERYHGRVCELRGDALLAEFERASDAVTAALVFQADQADYVDQLDDDIIPMMRVGIALGEVIIADNTVTGAGVVLAQRVEQLAEAGGVCITGAIHEALPHRMPFQRQNLGEHEIKGFAESVRVFQVFLAQGETLPGPETYQKRGPSKSRTVLGGIAIVLALFAVGLIVWLRPWMTEEVRPIDTAAVLNTSQPSIAVLPFENLSGDQEQRYFADGLADDLITDLSKLSGLVVIARNSSFQYRGMPGGVGRVAADLGVRYLLDGSVRRAGGKVRINAQLVDSTTGQHVWSDRYDQELDNIFSIQDEVTRQIVSALEVSLSTREREHFDRQRTSNFDAYDMLLRARETQALFTPEDNASGRALYEKAALLDPGYARAHSGVGLTHAIDVNMNWTEDKERSIQLGLEAVARAFELDDSLPQSYFAKGALLLSQHRYEDSADIIQRGISIAPNYADGHAQLAFTLTNAGRHDEALQAIMHAKRLNPRYSQVYLFVEAIALFHLERYEDVVPVLLDAIERNPAFDRPHVLLAATYGQLGRVDDADWALQEADILLPELSLEKERKDSILARDEDIERYTEGLRKAGLNH